MSLRRRGLIPLAVRGENGYRNYSSDILETLTFIHQAQDLGFTLDEVVRRKQRITALIEKYT
ncbi:MAG: MerR family transcriptional regulator [Pseudomonadota bacterium]|uniref:MerR family transcriptional regulator n=1 Tax=unclassified Sphingomonas TaxID=196159 RepID=UPI0009DE444B|nr:MerR family transcriptional regulator [Sphingomonas sp. TF3]